MQSKINSQKRVQEDFINDNKWLITEKIIFSEIEKEYFDIEKQKQKYSEIINFIKENELTFEKSCIVFERISSFANYEIEKRKKLYISYIYGIYNMHLDNEKGINRSTIL